MDGQRADLDEGAEKNNKDRVGNKAPIVIVVAAPNKSEAVSGDAVAGACLTETVQHSRRPTVCARDFASQQAFPRQLQVFTRRPETSLSSLALKDVDVEGPGCLQNCHRHLLSRRLRQTLGCDASSHGQAAQIRAADSSTRAASQQRRAGLAAFGFISQHGRLSYSCPRPRRYLSTLVPLAILRRLLIPQVALFFATLQPGRSLVMKRKMNVVFAKNSLPGQRPNRSGQGIVFNQQKHTLGRILTECVLPLH